MRLAFILAALVAAPVAAQVTPPAPMQPPPQSVPSSAAMPFMAMAGESDVFEITSSQVALQRSRDRDVREYASMMIEHHTETTNTLLRQARAAGLTPPPAVLSPSKVAMIDALYAAGPADFDRIYLMQQAPAHEQALAVHTTYASGGDTPQLRAAAEDAVPLVRKHLDDVRELLAAR